MTVENFDRGFLLDDSWMAGITQTPQGYLAYIVDLETGENLGSHLFSAIQPALESFTKMNRVWRFESPSECGGGCGDKNGETCHVKGGACNNCGACEH